MDGYIPPIRSDELFHYGVLGMHWGIRRYQPYPKNYAGDGREVGEARRTQDKIRKATVAGDAMKSRDNYKKLNEVKEVANKKDVIDSYNAYRDALYKAAVAQDKSIDKLTKDIKNKNGDINYNNQLIKSIRNMYKTAGKDDATIDEYLKEYDKVDWRGEAEEYLYNDPKGQKMNKSLWEK